MKTMDQITIPETTITDEQYAHNARQLIMTLIHHEVRRYCAITSESERQAILKDLRSPRMDFLSDGMSVITAERLEKNCEAIKARILKEEEEE